MTRSVVLVTISLITIFWFLLRINTPSITGTDIQAYVGAAYSIDNGTYASMGTAGDSFRPPGYPALIFLMHSVSEIYALELLLITQLLMLISSYLFIARLLLKKNGSSGLILVSLIFLHPETINLASTVSADFLSFILISVSAAYALFAPIKNRSNWAIIFVILGLSLYVKPVLIYLPIFMLTLVLIFYMWLKTASYLLKNIIIMQLIFLTLMSPWILRNYFITSDAVFSSSVGFNYLSYTHAIEKQVCKCSAEQAIKIVEDDLMKRSGLSWEGQLISSPSLLEDKHLVKVIRDQLLRRVFENPSDTLYAYVKGVIRGYLTPHNISGLRDDSYLKSLEIKFYHQLLSDDKYLRGGFYPFVTFSILAVGLNLYVLFHFLRSVTVYRRPIFDHAGAFFVAVLLLYLLATTLPWSNNIRYTITSLLCMALFSSRMSLGRNLPAN